MNLKEVAIKLIKENGFTTSLEVKNELRKLNPQKLYFQVDVSIDLSELADEGILEFIDNGKYREYTLAVKEQEVTKKEMCQAIADLEGLEVEIGYVNAKTNKYKTATVTIGEMLPTGYRVFIDGNIPKTFSPLMIKYLNTGTEILKIKKH